MFWKDLRAELQARDLPLILGGLSTAVAISGPFGSYAVLSMGQRFVFWFPVLVGTAICFFAFRVWAMRRFASQRRLWPSVLQAMVFALLVTPVFGMVFGVFFGPYFGTLAGWAEIAALVWLTSLGLCFVRHPANPGHLATDLPLRVTAPLADRRADAAVPDQIPSSLADAPRLIDRLPADKRGAILRLEVQDHYVLVTTAKGSSTVLMRLSDAMAETAPVEGAQVHRSFWVAWEAVVQAEQVKGRWYLSMRDGALVPVSRVNVTKLEARGLIRPDAGQRGRGIKSGLAPVRMARARGPKSPSNTGSSARNPPV